MPKRVNGAEPVRPEIALSWKRSRLSGVDPSATVPIDTTEVEGDTRLLRAAAPVLEQISQQISGTGFCVLLADRNCRIVASVYADDRIRHAVENLGVVDGSLLGEDSAGTNAVGTPLEMGRSMVIHGEEHFLDSFKNLSCYGQPVIHPITRRVEGILDMTGVVTRANPLFAPFLARVAADIEKRLHEGSRASEQRLVEAFQRVSNRRHVAVAAISDDFLLTNRTAMDLLGTADHMTLRSLAVDLAHDQSRLVDVQLASGIRVAVRADRVPGAEGGALFTVEELAQRKARPILRSRERELSHGDRLRRELERVREDTAALAISGESGTGRSSAAADAAGSVAAYWLNATDIVFDGVEAWTQRLVRASQVAPTVVVEQIELVPESILPIITDLVRSSAVSGCRIIVTSGPIPHLPSAAAAVVGRCQNRIQLIPLRERRREFAQLAQELMRDIAPTCRLSTSALDMLAAAPYPGNLAELKIVLTAASAARSSSIIEAVDLPDQYRVTERAARLGGREHAERQAIIEALKSCGGNKSHASTQLGISRSTLYARMRALDVTD